MPEGEALLDDYRFLQRASLRLRLLRDEPDDRLDPGDRPPGPLAGPVRGGLLDELHARMTRVRGAFTRVLGG